MKILELVVAGSFVGLLLLKVSGVVELSWWTVMAPLWIFASFLFVLFAVIGFCVVAIKMLDERRTKTP